MIYGFRGMAAIAALLTGTPMTAQAAEPDQSAEFRIGEAMFSMPVPDGLCIPAGKVAAMSQLTRAADTRNVTLLDFWACGSPEQASTHYVLLKVPTNALLLTLDKAATLDAVEKTLTGPDSPRFDTAFDTEVKQGIDKVTGLDTKVQSNFGYTGRDGDCLYMGGRVAVAKADDKAAVPGLVAVCITVVGGKVLNVDAYDNRAGARYQSLQDEAHALALTIRRANQTP
jgi:hypothetical protein